MGPYLDTSALAKWYLNEPFSKEFEAFIQEQPAGAWVKSPVLHESKI